MYVFSFYIIINTKIALVVEILPHATTMTYPFVMVNTEAADDLAPKGARASAAMVLT